MVIPLILRVKFCIIKSLERWDRDCFGDSDSMRNYRRLNSREQKKLNFYKNSGLIMKKSIKWWIVFFGIGCLFLVGMVFLCKFADSAGLEDSVVDMLALKSNKGIILMTPMA